MSDEYDLIFEFERDCEYFAAPIRRKICKRIFRTLYKHSKELVADDFDAIGMNYVDQISVLYQKYSLEEIDYGFEDRIWAMIEAEYEGLSSVDRQLLDYRHCSVKCEIDSEASKSKILSELCKMIDEHYYIKKIQNRRDKYDWL